MKRRRWGEEIPLLHVAVRLAVDIFQLHPGLLAPYAVGVLVKAVQQEAQELLRHQAGDTRARHGRTTDNTERPQIPLQLIARALHAFEHVHVTAERPTTRNVPKHGTTNQYYTKHRQTQNTKLQLVSSNRGTRTVGRGGVRGGGGDKWDGAVVPGSTLDAPRMSMGHLRVRFQIIGNV
eukprot:COSAG05_NODE_899_length_6679_cov_4.328419_5_plen_178_part_00